MAARASTDSSALRYFRNPVAVSGPDTWPRGARSVQRDHHRMLQGQGNLPPFVRRHAHNLEGVRGQVGLDDAFRRNTVPKHAQVEAMVVTRCHLLLQLDVEDGIKQLGMG